METLKNNSESFAEEFPEIGIELADLDRACAEADEALDDVDWKALSREGLKEIREKTEMLLASLSVVLRNTGGSVAVEAIKRSYDPREPMVAAGQDIFIAAFEMFKRIRAHLSRVDREMQQLELN